MSALHPQVFNIPSQTPFLPALAHGLLKRHFRREDPLAFARVTVYLPTRRAVRALAEEILIAAEALGLGTALALPRITPLGDVDEDALVFEADGAALDIPPAFPALRRKLMLMDLVRAFLKAREGHDGLSAAQALHLASALERLLDHAETQGASLSEIASLVTGDLARHWQDVVAFLAIVTDAWPKLQADAGAIGGAERRNRLMAAQRAALEAHPPEAPVIAAGSTGTIPATAQLLRAISRLPRGAVILPGLDQALEEAAWQAVDAAHAQGAMKALLATLGVTREDVASWSDAGGAAPLRVRVLNEALRPWAATSAWRTDHALREALDAAGGDIGVSVIEAPHRAAEADAIALILRETLERPGESAALITPDRTLAREVAGALSRWDIAVDDSAGESLALTRPAVFLRLLADAAAQDLAPVPLLALLKHPLTRLGLTGPDLHDAVSALERRCLRGPRPAPGLDGLKAAHAARPPGAEAAAVDDLLRRLGDALGPFLQALRAPKPARFAALIEAHIQAGEALARNAEGSAEALWSHDAGEALATLFNELLGEASHLPERPPTDYPAFLEGLMETRVVRPRFGRHPRLFIWGPLEARLQHCDVAILGGLNDGIWPAEAPPDPWLSRAMGASLGLPVPEQRLGLAAHDFVQGASVAQRVYLTHARKIDGVPAIPSRWLARLTTLLKGHGAREKLLSPVPWLGYVDALNRPPEYPGPVTPPAPTPPIVVRPRRLSVTRIATWLRDPYAIYAREVLGLKPLDPIDLEADARLRGTIVHGIVEAMAHHGIDPQAEDALARALALSDEIFARARIAPAVRAFWRPRLEASLAALLMREAGWRAQGEAIRAVECAGEIALQGPQGPFVLTARADRIDEMPGGALVIADFKTGKAPSARQIESCLEPQLPLEAAIAGRGGFGSISAAPVAGLRVVRLMARDLAVTDVAGADAIGARAVEYLEHLIARYDDAAMPYRSRVMVERQGDVGDYDHLARVKEWSAGGAEGEE